MFSPLKTKAGMLAVGAMMVAVPVGLTGPAGAAAITASKPVPPPATITVDSCSITSVGVQFTVSWTLATKNANPQYIAVYWEEDGVSFSQPDQIFSGFTKAQLKAEQATFAVAGYPMTAGDTLVVNGADWLPTDSAHSTPVARSTNAPIPCS